MHDELVWLMMGAAWMLTSPVTMWMTVVGSLLVVICVPMLAFYTIDISEYTLLIFLT